MATFETKGASTNAIQITKKDVENIIIDNGFLDERIVFKNNEYSNGKSDIGEIEYGTIVNIALGDLNNDGIQDAAFIAWFGVGTGFQQYYLFAVSGETGKIIVSKDMYLDDRIQVLSLKIKNNKIYWKAKVHKVHIGMALPPKDLVSAVFKVSNGHIVQEK